MPYVEHTETLFQSLFYWNLLSYYFPPYFINPFARVSILVLLEPPLILKPCSFRVEPEDSFNPCFTGTSSHTHIFRVADYCELLFQSLFYWNLLSYFRKSATCWQSTLVSILVLLEPPLILGIVFPVQPAGWSFNPCFTGTSSHTGFKRKS